MPLLPESLRGRAASHEADPFQYLQGVLAFFLGGGAVVALVLALTGLAPGALLLAGILWTIFGVLSGLLDAVLGPMIEWGATVLSNVGLARAGGGHSAGESMAAQLLAGPLGKPEAAVAELEALQRDADRLAPEDDTRLGLGLTELYEQQVADPGRTMVEVRRLIDCYPHAWQARQLRLLRGALRAHHFADSGP